MARSDGKNTAMRLSRSVAVERHEEPGLGVVGAIWIDNPPVNALSQHVREGLAAAVPAVADDPEMQAAVIVCRGRTFIAGADIREFGKPRLPPDTNEVRRMIEKSPKPFVAAIHGTALGGGLEMAMACHFRVADANARLGLPEVKLGILPGGGGTQRLPRLVGVPRALEMVTSGEHITAAEALDLGLIDGVVDRLANTSQGGALERRTRRQGEPSGRRLAVGAFRFALRAVAEGRGLPRVRDIESHRAAVRENPGIFSDFRRRIARRSRGFNAPEVCIQCIEAAAELPFDEGLLREAELSRQLHADPQSRAQRHYFFAERAARKIPDVPADTPVREVARVGVLGAGTMGGGISMAFANAGLQVQIVEQSREALDRGLATVRRNYDRSASRGRFTQEQVEERMGLLTGGTDRDALAECDLVIEAVFEDMELKKKVFAGLDRIVRPGALLATNTSYLDVNEIAGETKRPEDVVGMHFFSPANVMKLVEVVRGEKSAPDAIATAMSISRTIGKVPVPVGVCHGFVGNRMLFQRRLQADRLVLEGALPWDIDRVLYDFGMPMGPFRMSDLAGLDVGWNAATSSSSTLREMLCERDRRGRKTGRGYYVHDSATRAAAPDPEVPDLARELAERLGIEQREIDDEEILNRCLLSSVNEGAKILEEGIALRASDIDVIWINGYGWPVYRGGPMFWADEFGLDKITGILDDYAARFDPDQWRAAPLLRETAAAGGRLSG